MPHKLTRAEVEKMYPRHMFPNELAWQITVESRVGKFSCIGCEHLIEIDFDAEDFLYYEGVCRKHHKAIINKYISPCNDD